MHAFDRSVRETRGALGLTQTDLAVSAGVSLATVQNLEAGRANPSVGTLRRILAPLGLALAIEPGEADWDALAAHGLPLSSRSTWSLRPDADTLASLVRRAALELSRRPDLPDLERKRECLKALLHALRSHFPSRYRRWFRRSPLIRGLTPDKPSGRVIKLARIARDALARFL